MLSFGVNAPLRLRTCPRRLLERRRCGGDRRLFALHGHTAGYHYFADLPWIDALLNASMILAGMGPGYPVRTTAAKLFANVYALYSGIAFLTMVAILMAPVLLHRFLHKFHSEVSDSEPDRREQSPEKA